VWVTPHTTGFMTLGTILIRSNHIKGPESSSLKALFLIINK
jgi:hypothetical protein